MTAGAIPVAALRRLLTPPDIQTRERCELCGTPLPGDHGHVVDIRSRRMLCTCTVCHGSTGSYRPVPARYVHVPSMTISPEQWDALSIPVGLAFFLFNSTLGRIVACYPGPAGAAESVLPLDVWSALVDARSWIDTLTPDVEALLVRRTGVEYDCFIVPIDACYELVGRIKASWRGMSGGPHLQQEIDTFFAAVLGRSRAS